MIKTVGTVCVTLALILDSMSYWKQIAKVLRTKRSSQVSSSAYVYKITKVMFSMTGLIIYSNWVGFSMEVWMLSVYIASLIIIAKFKPKDWKLWN